MEWAAAAILAVVYLAWFGNHTAEKYRRLYGKLPEIQPDPPKRRFYRSPAVVDTDAMYTACGSYSVMMSSAVPLSRPGSIVRIEDWD